jgi:hypothetical protein
MIVELDNLNLDWGDEEDAKALVELLLQKHTIIGAWTWLMWPDDELYSTPLILLQQGKSRDVFRRALQL